MENKKINYNSIDEYIATFPETVPLPVELISEIVKLRVEQNTKKL